MTNPEETIGPSNELVKQAFLRCVSAGDQAAQKTELRSLEDQQPEIAKQVRSLLNLLEESVVGQITAFHDPQDRESPVQSSSGSSVFDALKHSIPDVPRVHLKSGGNAEPIVKLSSKESNNGNLPANSRYRVDGEIARGGMGAILKGRDTDLGRDLAIKVLLDSHRESSEVIRRFVEEAQIGGQLQHPGIVPVYDLGLLVDERPFFAMKLVKGKTLAALLAERKSPTDDQSKFLGILEQVCQTMAYAHSRGVIHRDLKPSNIMVGAFGEVQVMDWGLAKVLTQGGVADERMQRQVQKDISLIQTVRSATGSTVEGDDSVGSQTRFGSVMGTPAYMSREQALGETDQLDERTDVFALGSILCEILTGKPAYFNEKGMEVLRLASRASLDDAYQRLQECGAEPDLCQIAHDCLTAEPADRIRDAQVLTERITGYLESVADRLRSSELERVASETKAAEERKRRKVQLALAASLLAIITVGAGGWLWVQSEAAKVAKLKSDAQLAEINRRSQQQQQVERELASARALVDTPDRMPTAEQIQRATDSVGRAEALINQSEFGKDSVEQVAELGTRLGQLRANRQLVDRLDQLRMDESRYFSERDLPPGPKASPDPQVLDIHDEGSKPTDFHTTKTLVDAYREAFADWGLRFPDTSFEDSVRRLSNLPQHQRDIAVYSLDRWRVLSEIDPALNDLVAMPWNVAVPVNMKSSGTNERFELLDDRSILVSGESPGAGYEIVVETDTTEIYALRLEALTHESLPGNGPGRGKDGIFVFAGLKVMIAPLNSPQNYTECKFAYGKATYAATSWPFRIDHWHTYEGGGQDLSAYFVLDGVLRDPSGFRIKITNADREGAPSEVLGRFRWSTCEKASARDTETLHATIAEAESDAWRKAVREARENDDLPRLIELMQPENLRNQPTYFVADAVSFLHRRTDRDIVRAFLSDVRWQPIATDGASSSGDPVFEALDDGSTLVRSTSPDFQFSWDFAGLASTHQVIKLEVLSPYGHHQQERGEIAAAISDIRITGTNEDNAGASEENQNLISVVLADYGDSVDSSRILDGRQDTNLPTPNDDDQNTIYLVLDASAASFDELTLHTTLWDKFQRTGRVGRYRLSHANLKQPLLDPKKATATAVQELLVDRTSDPWIRLLAAEVSNSDPNRPSSKVFRHASSAFALDPTNVAAASIAFNSVDLADVKNDFLIQAELSGKYSLLCERLGERIRPIRDRAIEKAIGWNAQGDVDACRCLLDAMMVNDEESSSVCREALLRLYGSDWPRLAVEYGEKGLALQPDDAQLLNYTGVAHYRMGREGKGLQMTSEAYRLEPENYYFSLYTTDFLLRGGHFSEAALISRDGLKRFAENTNYLLIVAGWRAEIEGFRDLQLAEEIASRAIDLGLKGSDSGRASRVFVSIAQANSNDRNDAESIRVLDSAIQHLPRDTKIASRLAIYLADSPDHSLHDYSRALSITEKAVSEESPSPEIRLARGLAHLRLDSIEDAQRDLSCFDDEQAMETMDESLVPYGQAALALAYASGGQLAEAERLRDRADNSLADSSDLNNQFFRLLTENKLKELDAQLTEQLNTTEATETD